MQDDLCPRDAQIAFRHQLRGIWRGGPNFSFQQPGTAPCYQTCLLPQVSCRISEADLLCHPSPPQNSLKTAAIPTGWDVQLLQITVWYEFINKVLILPYCIGCPCASTGRGLQGPLWGGLRGHPVLVPAGSATDPQQDLAEPTGEAGNTSVKGQNLAWWKAKTWEKQPCSEAWEKGGKVARQAPLTGTAAHRGPTAEQGGVGENKPYILTVIPHSSLPTLLWGRWKNWKWKSEVQPGKGGGQGEVYLGPTSVSRHPTLF